MRPDTKAIRARALDEKRASMFAGHHARCDETVALCDRVEALEAALRDVLSVNWDVGNHPGTCGAIALRHARAALEGK